MEMLMRLCAKCKIPIKNPASYCEKCLPVIIKQREQYKLDSNKRYNKQRDPKYKEFYNSKEWKILKEKKLQDEQYQCERCHKLAVEVHHIKPIQTEEGWQLRLNYNNLESLCVDCHNFRHKRFQRRKAGDRL